MFVKAIITQKLKELSAQYRVLSTSSGCLCKALLQGSKAIHWCLTLERGGQKERRREEGRGKRHHVLQFAKCDFNKYNILRPVFRQLYKNTPSQTELWPVEWLLTAALSPHICDIPKILRFPSQFVHSTKNLHLTISFRLARSAAKKILWEAHLAQ